MTRKEYNGWYNYETWLFNLHWDSAFTEDAQELWDNAQDRAFSSREEQATFNLAYRIESIAEEYKDDCLHAANPWMRDLAAAAFSEINFHEIARHYIADLDKKQQ